MTDPPNLIEQLNDTEGLAWGLYYHLWKKTHKGEACPNINIPHTVVYQDSAPIAWYFMSSKDNKIYRKKRTNITGPSICEALSHKHPAVDACAWFSGTMTFMSATPKKRLHGGTGGEVYELEPEEDSKEPACFDYLSKDRLQRLVAPGQYTAITESIYDGILQKFVMPREAYDHVIRAIWSPTAVVCERRCSNFTLNDERQTLTDRMASFDANTFWLSTHQPLPAGSVLVQRLSTACESIVRHLLETSAGKISVARMQLYFKVDTHNRIWLTLCNSLRLDRSAVSVDRAPTPVKSSIKDPRGPEEDTHIPEDPTPFMCVITGATRSGSDRCDVSYKLLITDWFKQVAELEEESDRMQALDNIPPAIRRANPNITREYYLRMRAQTAPVCRSAAGDLTANAIKDLSRTIARPRSALADSAVLRQLGHRNPIEEAAGAAIAAAHSRPHLSAPSGILKLMINKGPPPPPPSDPNVLYEPGAQIPAALIPKAALTSPTGILRPTATNTRGATMVPVVRLQSQPPSQQQSPTQPSLPAVSSASRPAKHVTVPGRSVSQVPASISSPLLSGGGLVNGSTSPTRVKHTTAYTASPTAATPVSRAPGVPASKSSFDARPSKATDPPAQPTDKLYHAGEPYNPAGHRPTSARKQAPGLANGKKHGSDGSGSARTSHVSSDDLKKLRQLNEEYASAEAKTKQLLAEAKDILGDPIPPVADAPTLSRTSVGNSGSKRASGTGTGGKSSRPPSAKPPASSSKPPSGSGSSDMLQPQDGGVAGTAAPAVAAAGLTADEAALLSDALGQSHDH